MQINCEVIEENEDGSATCKLDMDREAVEALIERGFIALLKEVIESERLKNDRE